LYMPHKNKNSLNFAQTQNMSLKNIHALWCRTSTCRNLFEGNNQRCAQWSILYKSVYFQH
jgi:hypothetical protein